MNAGVTASDIGKITRQIRVDAGLTQAELAAACFVGTRFVSELENGKPTAEIGKVLQVLSGLGLELRAGKRTGWVVGDDSSSE